MNETKNFSEYVPAAYMRRAFLTDFHGSAGTAVVLRAGDGSEDDDNSNSSGAAAAYLWTDSRYWNEAGLQMDSRYWTLQKSGSTGVPTIPKWLASTALTRYQQNAASGANNNSNKPALRIGIDPFVHSASFVKEVQELSGGRLDLPFPPPPFGCIRCNMPVFPSSKSYNPYERK
jgi:Xaa-Pro aminopeptidase